MIATNHIMDKNNTNKWSSTLQQQTRDAINDIQISPHDGKLHFKNCDKRAACLTANDLLGGRLSLTDKVSGHVSEFADADGLLAAGWAID